MRELTYPKAIANAEHLLALGQTIVYIDDNDEAPWAKASHIEDGGSYRFSGPVSFYVIALEKGLTFKWSVDMEERDANGRGVSLFDRNRLREVARKLPQNARSSLAGFLESKVLPGLQKHTTELREALNKQADSEDCVRGLIAFAEDPNLKAA